MIAARILHGFTCLPQACRAARTKMPRDLCAGGCGCLPWLNADDSVWRMRIWRASMAHRRIGQEVFRFGAKALRQTSFDELGGWINWPVAERVLASLSRLLLATWYDLSDVGLAEALSDRASFRRFCGFPATRRRPSGPPSCASGASLSRTGSTATCLKRSRAILSSRALACARARRRLIA